MIYLLLGVTVLSIIAAAVMAVVASNARDKQRGAEEDAQATRAALEPLRRYENIRDLDQASEALKARGYEAIRIAKARVAQHRMAVERLSREVGVLKRLIQGYGDEYIIILDPSVEALAERYPRHECSERLLEARAETKRLVKSGEVMVGLHGVLTPSSRAIADYFNTKVDEILSRERSANIGKLRQEIIDTAELINQSLGEATGIRLSTAIVKSRVDELKWLTRTRMLQKLDREQQADIRSQMREEAKAIREAREAQEEAEREERIVQRALDKARKEAESASAEKRLELEEEIASLNKRYEELEASRQRAISMAEQTRQGHVYVISNIGSFGEGVFKIGMTRRRNPQERIDELGDASVPFSFDVHALIETEDAPTLEKALHHAFAGQRVNMINPRKEFFRASLVEIQEAAKLHGAAVEWTLASEALEFKESEALRAGRVARSDDLVEVGAADSFRSDTPPTATPAK